VKRIGDIRDVNGTEFGAVDLVCGGFPCQPFSTAGKRKGEADNRFLWPEMVRVIAAIRPTWVLGENVAGIISMALDKVHSGLESIGYTVQSFIIPACAIGAPHRRDRVWIIGNTIGEPGRATTKKRLDLEGDILGEAGWNENSDGTISSGSNVSNSKRMRKPQQEGGEQEQRGRTFDLCEDVPDSSGLRWREGNQNGGRCGEGTRAQEERIRLADNSWWSVEPELGRVAHGIPNRSHRLKALGNAVVPQIVEVFGRAIIAIQEAHPAQENGLKRDTMDSLQTATNT
jgi:DNA (cytosine-5)-methyltransferase 1